MSKSENERRVVIKPFPLSARAWSLAVSDLLNLRDDKKNGISFRQEKEIIEKHYPTINLLIAGLSNQIAENNMIDPLYYRAGLYVAFRAYRAEAHIRGGVLPEISQETLIQFLATDIEFSQNPTVNEQISMRRSQEELLGRFKVQESQAWHDLQKIKFASREMREGMHFGIANISVLIRKQSASQGGL